MCKGEVLEDLGSVRLGWGLRLRLGFVSVITDHDVIILQYSQSEAE